MGKEDVLPFTTTWAVPEHNMLSQISQRRTSTT